MTLMLKLYIEGICFFEVNTKYILSSELKTSEFSRVRSTSENCYVFNSRDEIYLIFTEKKTTTNFKDRFAMIDKALVVDSGA